jgi:hypothetical protein
VFERFRKKSAVQEALADSPVGKMVDQVALAVAVAESVGEYVRSRNGVPIIGDKDASVIEIWRGVRFEVISELWRHSVPLECLIDPTQHPKLLNAIIERSKSLLLNPVDPTGDEIKDTISAILRIYDRLDKLDSEVRSPYLQISRDSLGVEWVAPYAGFVVEMRKLHLKWQGYDWAIRTKSDLPPQPDIVFVALWRDVTYRSKIIALCAQWGPYYLGTFAAVVDLVKKRGESTAGLDNGMVRILAADDPDDAGGFTIWPPRK